MKILGIDPGTQLCGWCVLEDARYLASGTLEATGGSNVSLRLISLSRKIAKLLDQYKPDHLAIENGFVAKYATAAMRLGEARGLVISQWATMRPGSDVYLYEPALVKKSVAAGNGSKDAVQKAVNRLYNIKITSYDESDAVAVATCHEHRSFTGTLSDSNKLTKKEASKLISGYTGTIVRLKQADSLQKIKAK